MMILEVFSSLHNSMILLCGFLLFSALDHYAEFIALFLNSKGSPRALSRAQVSAKALLMLF